MLNMLESLCVYAINDDDDDDRYVTKQNNGVVQNCEKYPPPWLIAMQRYGPPPSYPTLKIAGLTAPIPEVRLLLFLLFIKVWSECSMWFLKYT